jgi:PAS domain S-box-containing protein
MQDTNADRAWLAAIVGSSDDAIVSKTLDGIVTSWNRGATRIFGYQPEEIIGQPILRLIPPELRDEEAEILSKLKRGERVEHFETVRLTKDGHLVDISLTISPVHDEVGNVIGASKIARDITEQKKAEKTRQLLLNELNHRVKNMLASVQAIVQGTLRNTSDPTQFVDSFSGRIQSLARVHSLLSTSTWYGADLRELIRDQIMRGPVDESRLTAWGPAVHLEPQMALHIALMLHELGTNSLKYGALSTPAGWITVSWTVVDAILNLQWVERGGPAARAPSKRGFGSTLVEQSAKTVGGKAQAVWELEGVTWQVTLPLPGPEAKVAASRGSDWLDTTVQAKAGARSPATASKLSGRRLLVIEDEPLVALDLIACIEDADGIVVGPAGSEKDALQLIETETVDAALLDANLHGKPVDRIAAALTGRNIPFVFVSGHNRDGLPAPFAKAPLVGKPFTHAQIVDTVGNLLQRDGNVTRLKL